VEGIPGIGKSTLAKYLAVDEKLESLYSDVLLFTALGATPDVSRILRNWERRLGLRVHDELSNEERIKNIRDYLHPQAALVVIDDVWNFDDGWLFAKLNNKRSLILITTRFPDVAKRLSPTESNTIIFSELSMVEALELFAYHAPEVAKNYRNNVENLLTVQGRLPLTVKLSASLLNKDYKSGSDIIQRFENLITHIPLLDEEDIIQYNPKTKMTPTVNHIIDTSYNELSAEAQSLYSLLGTFRSTPMHFDDDAILAISKLESAKENILELLKLGLMTELSIDNIVRYEMHSLLNAHSKNKLSSKEEYKMEKRYVEHYLKLAITNSSNNELLDIERANIFEALNSAYNILQDRKLKRLSRLFVNAVNAFSRYLGSISDYRSRIEFGKKGLDVAEEYEYHEAYAQCSASTIAWAYLQMGNREDLEQAKNYCIIGLDKSISHNLPIWATNASRSLSGIARDMSIFDGSKKVDRALAEEAWQWAHEARKYGKESSDIIVRLGAMMDLGYADILRGNPKRSERRFRYLLKIYEQRDDLERSSGRSFDVGLALYIQGKESQAYDMFQQMYDLAELKKIPSMIAEAEFSFAKVLGDSPEANRLRQKARNSFRKLGINREPRIEQFTGLDT
jgi:hypothetical protein